MNTSVQDWIRVASVDDVIPNEPLAFVLEDRHLALFKVDDDYVVIDNVCTHQFALLTDGYVEDGCVECPLHQALFDVRTGKALTEPATVDLVVHLTKVEDGAVFVRFVG